MGSRAKATALGSRERLTGKSPPAPDPHRCPPSGPSFPTWAECCSRRAMSSPCGIYMQSRRITPPKFSLGHLRSHLGTGRGQHHKLGFSPPLPRGLHPLEDSVTSQEPLPSLPCTRGCLFPTPVRLRHSAEPQLLTAPGRRRPKGRPGCTAETSPLANPESPSPSGKPTVHIPSRGISGKGTAAFGLSTRKEER